MSRTKLKKFKKIEKMTHVIQPSREDLLNDNFALKGCWSSKFENNNPIVLELGCGRGEYAVNLAKMRPDFNYIGIDIKGSRLYSGAEIAEKEKLKNLLFIRTQIEYISSIFAENEVHEIWITFPDPQIKFKRRKKRLTHVNMLENYKSILRINGVINLKTDSLFLHGYTLGVLENGPYKILKTMHDVYNNYYDDERLDIKTYYENKFLNQNQTITYVAFSFLY